MMKSVAALAAMLVLAAGLIGCGSKSTGESPAPAGEVASAPTTPAPAEPPPTTPPPASATSEPPAAAPTAPADTSEPEPAGPATPETVADEPPGEAEAEIGLEIDNWWNPVGMGALLARFRELEWVWTNTEAAGEEESTTVRYRQIGTETIQGRETTKIELTIDGAPWRIWLGDGDEVVQAEIEGEILPAEMTSTAIGPMLTGLFWPFTMVDAYRVDEVVAGEGLGWEMTVTDVGRRAYGDLVADVHEVVVTVSGPPYMEEGERSTLVWAIADFGSFQMLAEWRVIDADTADAFRMEIVRVVPR